MAYPMDLSHCLAFAPPRVPLVITQIPTGALRTFCAAHGLHEGDRVSRTAQRARELLLEKPDGESVVLPATYALVIEAAPLGGATAPREA